MDKNGFASTKMATTQTAKNGVFDIDTDYICIDHILGHCNACGKHHCSLPYQWQYQQQAAWTNFGVGDNVFIETAYCNANTDGISVNGVGMINFVSMTLSMALTLSTNKVNVRRLSTKSSVRLPDGHPFGTDWQWYWKNQSGIWYKYGTVTSPFWEQDTSIDIRKIEFNYQQYLIFGGNGYSNIKTSDNSNYTFDFATMSQIMSHFPKRPLLRRPKLVTEKDVREHPQSTSNSSAILSPGSKPSTVGHSHPVAVAQISPFTPTQSNPIDLSQNNNTGTVKPDPVGQTKTVDVLCIDSGESTSNGQCKRKADEAQLDDDPSIPVLWLYQVNDTDAWNSFGDEENLDIEASYCDASKSEISVFGIGNINFDSMWLSVPGSLTTSTTGRVRRLSSLLSSNCSSKDVWLWYWKDEHGHWHKYGEMNYQQIQALIGSDQIEEKYWEYMESFGPGSITFQTNQHTYLLDFSTMTQKNVSCQSQTKRPVRRRPKLLVTINNKRKQANGNASANSDSIAYPHTWDLSLSASDDSDYHLVDVPPSGPEYQEVTTLFKRTLSHSHVLSIKRIQNRELWGDYYRKRTYLEKKNGGEPVKEQQLFHGTKEEVMEAICQQNFDWRVSNSRCAYGQGSYFARDSVYSDQYSKRNIHKRGGRQSGFFMFVALVLVGSYTVGHSGILKPPPKNPKKPYENFYDSCVDNHIDPSIFVIFDSRQVYPQYLIEYI